MKAKQKIQVFILVGLVAVGLVVGNYLLSRQFIRWDLTEDKIYSLSDSTKEVLTQLNDRVTFQLFFTKEIPPYLTNHLQQVNDLFEEYRVYSQGKVAIKRFVPEEDPQKEQEARILGIPPLQLNVVERDKQEVRKVYLGMAILYEDQKEIIPVIADVTNLEYLLTSAILKLSAPSIPKVGLVLPDAEPGQKNSYEALPKVLKDQVQLIQAHFDQIKDLNANELKAVLVVEPEAVDASVVEKLDELINSGTTVILLTGNVRVASNLMAEPYQTGLEAWLAQKGIRLSNELLIDPNQPGRAAFYTGFVQYSIPYPFFVRVTHDRLAASNPITQRLEEVVFGWTNILQLDETKLGDWKLTILAESSADSFLQTGEPSVNPDVLNQLTRQPGEQHPLVVLLENSDPSKGKLMVSANSRFLENNFLNDYQTNLLFIQNAVEWVSWGDKLIDIRSRGKNYPLIAELSPQAITSIRWFHLLGIPVLFIGLGLLINGIRKKRQYQIAQMLAQS